MALGFLPCSNAEPRRPLSSKGIPSPLFDAMSTPAHRHDDGRSEEEEPIKKLHRAEVVAAAAPGMEGNLDAEVKTNSPREVPPEPMSGDEKKAAPIPRLMIAPQLTLSVDTIADAVCRLVDPFREKASATAALELEVRLCRHERDGSRVASRWNQITIAGPGSAHAVQVGVDRNAFSKVDSAVRFLAAQVGSLPLATVGVDERHGDVRVTRNPSGMVTEVVNKRRLAVLDIFVPGFPCDLRFAISREEPLASSEISRDFSREVEIEAANLSDNTITALVANAFGLLTVLKG